jgi:hypothetical protein
MPEAHTLLMVVAGTVKGRPAYMHTQTQQKQTKNNSGVREEQREIERERVRPTERHRDP